MTFSRKTAYAAVVAGLVAALLAGCSGTADKPSNGVASSSAAVVNSKPDTRQVRALEVIDPLTVVVTPVAVSDKLYGTNFTVHIDEIVTPSKGECGYDQAFALAKSTLPGHVWFLKYDHVTDGVYIDGNGDHHGELDSRGTPYDLTMIGDGMAHLPKGDASPTLTGPEQDAKTAGRGLWTSCDGFGA